MGYLARMLKTGLITLMFFTASFAEARVLRLDQGTGFFRHYANTNQGALATCYAHPASVLIDEYLSRGGANSFTFPRNSPLASSLYFAQSQGNPACVKDEVFGPSSSSECRALPPTVTLSRIEGGSVSLAAASFLRSGKRFDYQDLEGKLGRSDLDPTGFSKSDMFGESLNESFTRCRGELLQLTGAKKVPFNGAPSTDIFRLSGENLPACHQFEVELARIKFTWVNPPEEFKRLTGVQFSTGNNLRVPNVDAIRNLTLKYKSSYSSLLSILEAFSHVDLFDTSMADRSPGLIQRYYFKSGGKPAQPSQVSPLIQEFVNPGPAELNRKVIAHLNDGHPVSVCMDLNPLQHKGLIADYYRTSARQKPTKHCVTIMGYRGPGDSVSGTQVTDYLVRNSWRHNSESRCSKVFLNHQLVECESKTGSLSTNSDSGNFWLNAQGMIEIMKHYGELTLVRD